MHRLGYERYAVHGGDIGAGVAGSMSSVDPERVVAVHVTSDAPTAVTFASWMGDPTERPGLSDADKGRIAVGGRMTIRNWISLMGWGHQTSHNTSPPRFFWRASRSLITPRLVLMIEMPKPLSTGLSPLAWL